MKKHKKILGLLLFAFMPFVITRAQGIDIVSSGASLLKYAKAAKNMSDNAQQVLELKSLIEDLACMKYEFDQLRYSKSFSFDNCLISAEIRLIDIEYSALYKAIVDIGADALINTASGETTENTLESIIVRVRNVTEKMKNYLIIEQNENAKKVIIKQHASDQAALLSISI